MDNDLLNLGFGMMANASQPGATAFGSLGAGGLNMMQGRQQQVDLAYKNAQMQALQMQNQLIQPQIELSKLKMDEYKKRYGAGAPASPAVGGMSPTATNPGEAQQESVRPSLSQVSATRLAESGGNAYAVSPKGARGLMQLMPGTQNNPGFGVTPAKDDSPEENMRVGTDYLSAMNDRYKDKPNPQLWGQVAYNWGPDNADKWTGALKALPAETQKYVKTVNDNMGGQLFGINQPYDKTGEKQYASSVVTQPMAGEITTGDDTLEIQDTPQMIKSRKRIEALSNKLDSDAFIGLPTESTQSSLKAEQDRLTELLKAQTELANAAAKKSAEVKGEGKITDVEHKDIGGKQVSDVIADLRESYNKLNVAKGAVNDTKGGWDNAKNYAANTKGGQIIGKMRGTPEQTIRNDIAMARPLLIQGIRQATGMSAKAMDSNTELQFYLQAATDPTSSIQSNLRMLDKLESMYGLGGKELPAGGGGKPPTDVKAISMSDIEATAKKHNKTVEQVKKDAEAKGYVVK